MGYRLLVFALLGLLAGTVAGGALQIGFNVLRFLIQPDWLAGGGGALLIALLGVTLAAMLAGAFAYGIKRALGGRARVRWLFVATAFGLLLDPYFLAEFGWTTAARAQIGTRALALALPAIALPPILALAGNGRVVYGVLVVSAVAVFAALPRFALLPALGGQLDLAAMSPIYLLVYVKGLVLLSLAAALSLIFAGIAGRTRS